MSSTVVLWNHLSFSCHVHANSGSVCVPTSTPIIPAVQRMTTPKPSLKSTSQRLACLQVHFFVLAFAKILCFSNKEHFMLPLQQHGYFLTILYTSMPVYIFNINECHILSIFPSLITNKTQNFATTCNNKIISLHCPLNTWISHTILNLLTIPKILHFTIRMQWTGKIVAISIQYSKLTWQLVQPANSPKGRRLLLLGWLHGLLKKIL